MALDAADAHFMDELFADLDASHFSIPPSQSPPKIKPTRLNGSQASPVSRPKLQRPTSSRSRSPLSETTRFQSQTASGLDLEDWFQLPTATPKPASRHSLPTSTVKRQKLDHGRERVPRSTMQRPRRPREKCTYIRCRVLAIVEGTYDVPGDGQSAAVRSRPEKVLVLETDRHDQKKKRADLSLTQTAEAQQPVVYLASLRDDWMQTMVSTGDIVHLVGRFETATKKVPIALGTQGNGADAYRCDVKSGPAIEIAFEEPKDRSPRLGALKDGATSVESDDELWDDLASLPSLSQCATQEMLASDSTPQAQVMIFASRTTSPLHSKGADHALDNLLVVHPDVLVPATKVADVASCIRKPVVQDRLRGASDVSLSLVMGNMLHELLQACLTASSQPYVGTHPPRKLKDTQEAAVVSPWPDQWHGIGDFSSSFVDQQIEEQVRSNVESLYAIELSAEEATVQLRERAAAFARFARVFLLQDDDESFHPEANLREQGRSPASAPGKVRLRRVLDVEEDIWSPAFGLKGKVDVSVECEIVEGSDSVSSRKADSNSHGAFSRGAQKEQLPKSASRVSTSVVPLELKTGRAEVVSTEHRAQTMLYTLMMSDRYATRVSDGLLYYSKSGEMHRISRSRNEVRSLIIGRNELAHYLRHDPSRLAKPVSGEAEAERIQVLPPTIDSEYKCGRCYAVDGCMLFRRAIENVVEPAEGASMPTSEDKGVMLTRRTPIADLYEQKTSHLSLSHVDFFRKWNRLLSLEEEDAVRIRREMWTMSAEQRERAGRCFANMRLDVKPPASEEPTADSSMRRVVHRFVRRRESGQNAEASVLAGHISVNDPVTISIEPDMLSVAQGFVSRLTPTSVEIGLDHSLDAAVQRALERDVDTSDGKPFEREAAADRIVFRIDKDELGSGMGRVRANLAALFMTAQRGGDVKRRELVVDMRPPRFVQPGQMEGDGTAAIVAQARADPSLNEDQRLAIDKVLSAQDYALVLGMPGTGKTTTIAKLIQLLVRLGKRILLTSYTHSAVDTILRKLADDVKTEDEERGMQILRLGSKDKVHPDAHQFLLPRCSTLQELREAFESPNVVAATCLSVHHTFFSSGMAKLRSRRDASPDGDGEKAEYLFDYCIVDEASQIPLPTCLGPLRFADKFVLVGDHFQLPPLVKNAEAKAGGLDVSLFKLLCEQHGEAAMVALRSQYRMNADIMRLANELVYSGQLRTGTEGVRDRCLRLPRLDAALSGTAAGGQGGWMEQVLQPESKVRFIDTAALPLAVVGESKNGELVKNQFEAELVLRITEALLVGGCGADRIGVVTPYRQQIKLLRSLVALGKNAIDSVKDVEILTADQSQGRDKDVIIVTFTRANHDPSDKTAAGSTGELLNDLRRLNVSLTRAKRKLILIGHSPTLQASHVLSPLLSLLLRLNWITTLPSPP